MDWFYVDANDDLVLAGGLSGSDASTGSSGAEDTCPGAGAPDHGVVYNYMENQYHIVPNAPFPTGDSASPSAYYPQNNSGYEDCQSQGKMIYWTYDGMGGGVNKEYHISLNLNPNTEKAGQQFCVRNSVSVGGNGDRLFPESNPLQASEGSYNAMGSYANGVDNLNTVANHVAKQSEKWCYQIDPNQPPTGNMVLSCFLSGVYTVKGNDPDHDGDPVKFRIIHPNSSGNGYSTDVTGTTTSAGTTAGHTFVKGAHYYYDLFDEDSQTWVRKNDQVLTCSDATPPTLPSSVGCPNQKQGLLPVNLPDTDGLPANETPSTYGGPGPALGYYGVTVHGTTPSGNGSRWLHHINSVYDNFGEADGGYLPYQGWANNAFAIDYTPFMRAYPYDQHKISINYNTQYTDATYVYDYGAGDWYCPGGQYVIGSLCSSGYIANTTNPKYGPCPFGGAYNGSVCLTGIVGNASQNYYATLHALATSDTQAPVYDGAPVLPPCYQRAFNIDHASTTVGNVQLSPSAEDPTSANVAYNLAIDYSLPATDTSYQPYDRPQSPPVRDAFQAVLSYVAHYSVNGGGDFATHYGTQVMNASLNEGKAPTNTINDAAPISVPTLKPGDQVCVYLDVYNDSGNMDNVGNGNGNGSIQNQTGTGSYSTTRPACTSPHVGNEPYVHFLGSDVRTGGGFGDTTCTNNPGGIKTYLYSTGTKARGSGAQFGAEALGVIEGFGSANLRTSTPTGTTGLTFSNQVNVNTANMTDGSSAGLEQGGQFGASSNCVPDYFAKKPVALTTPTVNGTPTVGTDGAQYYKSSAGTSINVSGGSIANGVNQAIYIDGDVSITGNISFADTTRSGVPVDQIPSFYIVATGNIYVSPGVTQLDGVYVAQPKSGTANSGNIDTCADTTGSFLKSYLYGNCNKQLTVNGAFVAQKIKLNRTFSSLRYSTSGENPQYTGARSNNHSGLGCGLVSSQEVPNNAGVAAPDCAAEIFNFSPELYLSRPASIPVAGPSTGKYDFITSLSPVL